VNTLPRRLWDISPPLGPDTPVFPGDQGYAQRWTATLGPDSAANVSALTLSPHLGAHADAPLHYADGAPAIGELDLAPFLGLCRVVHTLDCGPLIRPEHLAHAVAGLPPRLLVRTCRRAATTWTDHFTAFAPETIEWLAGQGVRLIGLDTPSVDPADSTALDSHQRLLRLDLRVLENLVLDEVPAGDYELIALPLRLMHAEASPVRAVLRSLPLSGSDLGAKQQRPLTLAFQI
jgi:arylformamidase